MTLLATRTRHADPVSPIHRSSAQEYTRTSATEYTLTTSGTVVVITSIVTAVVSGPDPSSTAGGRNLNGADSGSQAFFDNTGAVAGTFVAVGLVAAGIIVGLGFFFLRRKRRRQLDEDIRVAAGGAGDGGAGINRFAGDDDDDDEDSFDRLGGGSEGHLSSNYMSSYGTVPLTAAAAGAGFTTRRSSAGGDWGTAAGAGSRPSYDLGHSPAQSQGSILPPVAGAGGYNYGPAGYGAYGGGATSHEGVLHDNWAEYVEGAGAGAAAGGMYGGGSAEGGSHEGFGASLCFVLITVSAAPDSHIRPQPRWEPPPKTRITAMRARCSKSHPSATRSTVPTRRTTRRVAPALTAARMEACSRSRPPCRSSRRARTSASTRARYARSTTTAPRASLMTRTIRGVSCGTS